MPLPRRPGRPTRRQVLAAAMSAGVLGAAACGSDERQDPDPSSPPAEPEPTPSATAEAPPVTGVATSVVDEIGVWDEPPAAEVDPTSTLDRREETSGELVFVVREQRPGWLAVDLPVRPNGSTGWVREQDVSLTEHTFAVEVDVTAHRLVVTQAGEVLVDEPVGVGTTDTPTPGGRYYIKELLAPPDPDGPYGPYAYGLSGFSNVLTSFAGGDGVIGIHGTDDAAAVGTDVSNGCLRVQNDVITRLVEQVGLPLGTPVSIVA